MKHVARSKYNIGDEVWIMWRNDIYHSIVRSVRMESVKLNIMGVITEELKIIYGIHGLLENMYEEGMFNTSEELISSLRIFDCTKTEEYYNRDC